MGLGGNCFIHVDSLPAVDKALRLHFCIPQTEFEVQVEACTTVTSLMMTTSPSTHPCSVLQVLKSVQKALQARKDYVVPFQVRTEGHEVTKMRSGAKAPHGPQMGPDDILLRIEIRMYDQIHYPLQVGSILSALGPSSLLLRDLLDHEPLLSCRGHLIPLRVCHVIS